MWEHSYKRLELAQLLGKLGVFLTCVVMLHHGCGCAESGALHCPPSLLHAPIVSHKPG